MRLSSYEIILPMVGTDEKPIEGYMLLTNGLYGAVDVVPKEDADKLQAGDFAGLPAALRERLMLRGHITRKDEAGELADLKHVAGGDCYHYCPPDCHHCPYDV